MKKFLIGALILPMTASIAACGGTTPTEPTEQTVTQETLADDPFKVATPTGTLCYAFDHEPTVEELRATAVQAMKDQLSVQWYTPKGFKYNKTGAASGKDYIFDAYTHYAGLPYANAQRSVFGMLEFIDGNGKLDEAAIMEDAGIKDLGTAVNKTIGNTCSGSTCWALFSVCNSISGPCIAYNLVYQNGFLPVGDYTYDFNISTFTGYTTTKVCEDNGRDVMYASYAKALPADLLVVELAESGKEHSVMVVENHVVTNADGSINPTESTMTIQDQYTGFYDDVDAEGKLLKYVGHTGANAVQHTYEQWFNLSYIPVTTAEFMGDKAYEKGEVKMQKDIATWEDLKGNKITSNYPQALVKLVAVADGKETMLWRNISSRNEINDKTAFNVATSKMVSVIQKAGLASGTKLEVRVTLSTGEVVTPVSLIY